MSLQILDISNSCIGSEGCKAISEALKNCTNLKEFNVSGNFLMMVMLKFLLRHSSSVLIFTNLISVIITLVEKVLMPLLMH